MHCLHDMDTHPDVPPFLLFSRKQPTPVRHSEMRCDAIDMLRKVYPISPKTLHSLNPEVSYVAAKPPMTLPLDDLGSRDSLDVALHLLHEVLVRLNRMLYFRMSWMNDYDAQVSICRARDHQRMQWMRYMFRPNHTVLHLLGLDSLKIFPTIRT
jgi:hypothetical protein